VDLEGSGHVSIQVGDKHSNLLGEYTAVKIDGDDLFVEYTSRPGIRVKTSLVVQERIVENLARKEMLRTRPPEPSRRSRRSSTFQPFRPAKADWARTPLYYRTVGLLAANASNFTCAVPHKDIDRFQATYRSLTGETAGYDTPGISERDVTDMRRDWLRYVWLSWKISFNADDHTVFRIHLMSQEIRVANPDDGYPTRRLISNNALCWELVDLGFRPGLKHQDVDAIRALVPATQRAEFDRGLAGYV
jgi:hypothetical protein